MPLPLAIPLIAAGLGTAFNALTSWQARKKQRQHELQLSQYAYSKDLEMWNRQNEYNTPEAQRQRLIDAGLNPALMYKSMPQNVAVGQQPKYNAPRQEYSGTDLSTGGIINAYQDFRMKNAQVDLLKKQEQLTRYKTGTELSRQQSINLANIEREYRLGVISGTERDRLQRSIFAQKEQQSLQYKDYQIDALEKQISLRQKELEWYTFNRLAAPVSQTLRLIPGLGRAFNRYGVGRKIKIGKSWFPIK